MPPRTAPVFGSRSAGRPGARSGAVPTPRTRRPRSGPPPSARPRTGSPRSRSSPCCTKRCQVSSPPLKRSTPLFVSADTSRPSGSSTSTRPSDRATPQDLAVLLVRRARRAIDHGRIYARRFTGAFIRPLWMFVARRGTDVLRDGPASRCQAADEQGSLSVSRGVPSDANYPSFVPTINLRHRRSCDHSALLSPAEVSDLHFCQLVLGAYSSSYRPLLAHWYRLKSLRRITYPAHASPTP